MNLTYEFTIHGGFEVVSAAWQYVALFFHDAAIRKLMYIVLMLGVTFSTMGGLIPGASGGKLDPFKGAKAILVATLLYGALIDKSGTLQIYDDVKNKTVNVDNLPIGIVAVAGNINILSTSLEHEIDSLISPTISRANYGYGVVGKILQETGQGRALADILMRNVTYGISKTIANYADDCLSVQAAHDSSLEDELRTSSNLVTTFGKGNNPGITFLSYLNDTTFLAESDSHVTTCKVGWDAISNQLTNAPDFSNAMKDFCNFLQFDSVDAGVYTSCKDLFKIAINDFTNGGLGLNEGSIMKMYYLNSSWHQLLDSMDDQAQAARTASFAQASAQMASGGLISQEMLPYVKNGLLMVIIGITPIVCIFLMSEQGIEAFKLLIGLYVYWAMFCVSDAVIENLWLVQLDETFNIVRKSSMGVDGYNIIWPYISKSLNVLGNMRGFGMLLSGMITFGLFKFGGSAMSQFAARASGSVTNAGAGAGASMLDPGGSGRVQHMSAEHAVGDARGFSMSPGFQREAGFMSSGMFTAGETWSHGNAFNRVRSATGGSNNETIDTFASTGGKEYASRTMSNRGMQSEIEQRTGGSYEQFGERDGRVAGATREGSTRVGSANLDTANAAAAQRVQKEHGQASMMTEESARLGGVAQGWMENGTGARAKALGEEVVQGGAGGSLQARMESGNAHIPEGYDAASYAEQIRHSQNVTGAIAYSHAIDDIREGGETYGHAESRLHALQQGKSAGDAVGVGEAYDKAISGPNAYLPEGTKFTDFARITAGNSAMLGGTRNNAVIATDQNLGGGTLGNAASYQFKQSYANALLTDVLSAAGKGGMDAGLANKVNSAMNDPEVRQLMQSSSVSIGAPNEDFAQNINAMTSGQGRMSVGSGTTGKMNIIPGENGAAPTVFFSDMKSTVGNEANLSEGSHSTVNNTDVIQSGTRTDIGERYNSNDTFSKQIDRSKGSGGIHSFATHDGVIHFDIDGGSIANGSGTFIGRMVEKNNEGKMVPKFNGSQVLTVNGIKNLSTDADWNKTRYSAADDKAGKQNYIFAETSDTKYQTSDTSSMTAGQHKMSPAEATKIVSDSAYFAKMKGTDGDTLALKQRAENTAALALGDEQKRENLVTAFAQSVGAFRSFRATKDTTFTTSAQGSAGLSANSFTPLGTKGAQARMPGNDTFNDSSHVGGSIAGSLANKGMQIEQSDKVVMNMMRVANDTDRPALQRMEELDNMAREFKDTMGTNGTSSDVKISTFDAIRDGSPFSEVVEAGQNLGHAVGEQLGSGKIQEGMNYVGDKIVETIGGNSPNDTNKEKISGDTQNRNDTSTATSTTLPSHGK